MRQRLTRAHLLSGGVRGGAALLLGGSALGVLAATADATPPSAALGTLPVGDLAYVRLLIGVELLMDDFYTQALASGHLRRVAREYANLALTDEGEHYVFLASALTGAGGTPLTSADVEFSYPAGSFYTAASVTGLAVTLESLALGACLAVAGNLSSPVLAQAVAQITANEAQHLSAVSRLGRQPAFHDAFPQAMTIAEASDALDSYTS